MTLSDEEKIQKAEAIYYRRNGMNFREKEPKEKKHPIRNFLIITIVILALIGYQNKEYIQSPEFKEQIKTFLNTKIDINKIFTLKEEQIEDEVKVAKKEAILEKVPEYNEIIWPYNGTITSEFGQRTSEDSRVTSNHTGIDIAGNIGDNIVSAINGKVVLVSEEGDLGKHIKIENEKYATVYAHCSEISVSEGQEVTQNEIIGKVGNTGNSTGAHLHFEVISQGEYIDPLSILEKQVANEN